MKPIVLTIFLAIFGYNSTKAQDIEIDLAQKKSAAINNVEIKSKTVKLINRSKSVTYKLHWKSKLIDIPPFQTSQLSSNDFDFTTCSKDIQNLIDVLDNGTDEAKIKK